VNDAEGPDVQSNITAPAMAVRVRPEITRESMDYLLVAKETAFAPERGLAKLRPRQAHDAG
jgi:hypothetical protein